eukprot:14263-Prymnesium_polylepis.1
MYVGCQADIHPARVTHSVRSVVRVQVLGDVLGLGTPVLDGAQLLVDLLEGGRVDAQHLGKVGHDVRKRFVAAPQQERGAHGARRRSTCAEVRVRVRCACVVAHVRGGVCGVNATIKQSRHTALQACAPLTWRGRPAAAWLAPSPPPPPAAARAFRARARQTTTSPTPRWSLPPRPSRRPL